MVGLMTKRAIEEGDKPKKKKGGLKVRPEDARIINLIATYRSLSVEKLFMQDDVQDFLKHLLWVEQQKQTGGHEAKPKR